MIKLLSILSIIPMLFISIEPAKANKILSAVKKAQDFHKNLMSEEASHAKKVIRATKGYRPQSCSMYGNEYTDIAAKMKKVLNVLENDKECLSRIGGSIKNLETDLTKLNKFQIDQTKKDQQISTLVLTASGGSSTKATTVELAEQQIQAKERERYMGAVNSTLKGLNSIASNVACKDSFSSSEAIGMVSDVIVGTTSFGLTAPGPVGTGVALGGMAVGSLLKVLTMLLKQKWDFRKEEDRVNFVKLNCSFFQLKSDMDEVGILQVRTNEHNKEINRLKSISKRVQEQVSFIQKTLDKDNKMNKFRNAAKIVAKLTEGNPKFDGRKNTRLYYLFKEISSYINHTAIPAVRSNDDKRAKILVKMFNYYTQLKELVNDPSINMGTTGKILHFAKFAKGYSADNLIGNAKSADQLWQKILKAPAVSTGNEQITAYEYFIKNFLGPIDWLRGIQQQKIMGGSLATLVRSPTIKALVTMEKFKYIISKINTRIGELEKFKTGGIFSDSDDGSAIKANILIGFKEIEATVYGKVGANFLTYVSKNGNNSIKSYLGYSKNLLKDKTITSINNQKCAEANKVMTEYGIAESLTNMGYDFLAINMDSFFKPKKFHSYLRWRSEWHQRHIQNHVKSIKLFREKYGEQKQIPLADKNKFKAILYTPMASLMFRIKQSQINLGKIQSYVEKARCKGRRDAKLKLSF